MPPPEMSSNTRPDQFHVLVVDDEEKVCQTICGFVEQGGYQVTGVGSAYEALTVLKETPIHLVLTDLMMPEVSGWQLLKVVKEHFSHIPVVIFTGYISEQAKAQISSENANGYLTKPIESRRLYALLKALLYPNNLGWLADVVILDNDNNVMRVIDQAVSERGIYTHIFQDPSKALMHIRNTIPHLLITELNLKNMNGFDLCQSLWANPNTANLPVVMLASHPSKDDVITAIQTGVKEFIVKPFDVNVLEDRVVDILQKIDVPVQVLD